MVHSGRSLHPKLFTTFFARFGIEKFAAAIRLSRAFDRKERVSSYVSPVGFSERRRTVRFLDQVARRGPTNRASFAKLFPRAHSARAQAIARIINERPLRPVPSLTEAPSFFSSALFADVQRMGDRHTVSGGRPRLLQIAAHFGQQRKQRLGKQISSPNTRPGRDQKRIERPDKLPRCQGAASNRASSPRQAALRSLRNSHRKGITRTRRD